MTFTMKRGGGQDGLEVLDQVMIGTGPDGAWPHRRKPQYRERKLSMDGYLMFAAMTGLWFMVLMLLEESLRRGIGHIAKWTVEDDSTGTQENFEDQFAWQKGSPDRHPHEMEDYHAASENKGKGPARVAPHMGRHKSGATREMGAEQC